MSKKEDAPLTEAVYYILLALEQPRHGYAIMQYITEISHERINMGPGTLYGALKSLLEKEWIALIDAEVGSRKKEYILTGLGREVIDTEMIRLEELLTNGEKIMKR